MPAPPPDDTAKRTFLVWGTVLESSLFALAGLIAWIWPLEVSALQQFGRPTWQSLGAGILATIPLLIVYAICQRITWAPIRGIRELLNEFLGPGLRACSWYQLLFIATITGIAEEVLFRGVLQPRLGLIGSNLVFGLAHAATTTYFVMAALIGTYLGWVAQQTDLYAAIIAHGLYDFVLFLLLSRPLRSQDPALQPASPDLESKGVESESDIAGIAAHGKQVPEPRRSRADSGDHPRATDPDAGEG